jgi:hypothetical protein
VEGAEVGDAEIEGVGEVVAEGGDAGRREGAHGLRRKANGLPHHALFAAAIAKAKSVTTEHVQAAMQEIA